MTDLYTVREDTKIKVRKMQKKLALFTLNFSREKILSLNTKKENFSVLEGFDKFDEDTKRQASAIITVTQYFLKEFNKEKTMDEFAENVEKNPKDIKVSSNLAFYLACRMLELHPETEKFKKFKKDVEDYLGVEPY